jgi:hypothetical protein
LAVLGSRGDQTLQFGDSEMACGSWESEAKMRINKTTNENAVFGFSPPLIAVSPQK